MTPIKRLAVVVFSGGQDSTTCLAWARKQFDDVHALTFDYGQRHAVELQAARDVAEHLGVKHTVADLSAFGKLSASALTRADVDVATGGGLHDLPSTFTPGRNLVFLTMAASYAISVGSRDLITGVCETDYSGYPDCRRQTIDALEKAINLGNGLDDFQIHTPLMFLNKAQTVALAQGLGALDALALSHTCYMGARPACGMCPACVLRLKGFAEAGVTDPIAYAPSVG